MILLFNSTYVALVSVSRSRYRDDIFYFSYSILIQSVMLSVTACPRL